MSESEKPNREKKSASAREPRALSSEYHKARKQLMLWAGILFIWELIGVDLNRASEAGGNIGTIINSIKSPQAIPWVLLVLIGYFIVKLRIEWRQCSEARRQVREAKQDYYMAFIIAGVACVLYFGQAIIHIQFADYFSSAMGYVTSATSYLTSWSSVFVGFLAGIGLGPGVRAIHGFLNSPVSSRYLHDELRWPFVVWAPVVLLIAFLISLLTGWQINWTALLTTMGAVSAVFLVASYLIVGKPDYF